MLDIHVIRENPERILEGLRKKKVDVDLDMLLKKDLIYRELSKENDNLKHLRNMVTQEINQKKRQNLDASHDIEKMRIVNSQIKEHDQKIMELQEEIREFLIRIPNIPHESVPVGSSDRDNVEIRRWGTFRDFS
ncbi:MAG: serine--tRNA ligase, partial [Candidatus Marinimicrobia bacterium]|nr:serine--tRNA ligase [Candidatus Neomarinimicrobiota bacterium]